MTREDLAILAVWAFIIGAVLYFAAQVIRAFI